MTRSTIENRTIGNIFSIVDEYRPDLNEEEKTEVCEFLKREDEGEEVVWKGLCPAVDGVEGNCGVGCGHDPFVVCFV